MCINIPAQVNHCCENPSERRSPARLVHCLHVQTFLRRLSVISRIIIFLWNDKMFKRLAQAWRLFNTAPAVPFNAENLKDTLRKRYKIDEDTRNILDSFEITPAMLAEPDFNLETYLENLNLGVAPLVPLVRVISRRCMPIAFWVVVVDARLRAICWRATFARRLRLC
jgi:hypothetical protein